MDNVEDAERSFNLDGHCTMNSGALFMAKISSIFPTLHQNPLLYIIQQHHTNHALILGPVQSQTSSMLGVSPK